MINKKYEPIVFAFVMGLFMSGFMSLAITFFNLSMVENFVSIWLTAYYKAFIVAFPTIMIVVPFVKKFVKFVVK